MTESVSVDSAFRQIADEHESLDLAVLNAGVFPQPATVADAPDSAWRTTFDVNLFGVVACARDAIPLLLSGRDGGKIIIVGSGNGQQAHPNLGAYAASKAAVASLLRTLAVELRDQNIAVNELIPGPVKTDLNSLANRAGTSLSGATQEWTKEPEDVVGLALLLARFPNNGPSRTDLQPDGTSSIAQPAYRWLHLDPVEREDSTGPRLPLHGTRERFAGSA